jgi:hypothetical protein
MNEPDIGQVEKRLIVIIVKERWEAIGYMLLIVLYTPACEKIYSKQQICA